MANLPIRGKADIGQIAHTGMTDPAKGKLPVGALQSPVSGKTAETNAMQKQRSRAEGAMLTGKQEHCESTISNIKVRLMVNTRR